MDDIRLLWLDDERLVFGAGHAHRLDDELLASFAADQCVCAAPECAMRALWPDLLEAFDEIPRLETKRYTLPGRVGVAREASIGDDVVYLERYYAVGPRHHTSQIMLGPRADMCPITAAFRPAAPRCVRCSVPGGGWCAHRHLFPPEDLLDVVAQAAAMPDTAFRVGGTRLDELIEVQPDGTDSTVTCVLLSTYGAKLLVTDRASSFTTVAHEAFRYTRAGAPALAPCRWCKDAPCAEAELLERAIRLRAAPA